MKRKYGILISFILFMVMLGMSDSLRGIFLPIFQSNFGLSTTEVSFIITCSYLGNLLFLLGGGYFVDKYKRKYVMMSILGIWTFAGLLFILTNNYYALLMGMFLSMGASTLFSTTINVLTPIVFISTPGLMINVLGFTQGVGTSASQNFIGKYAKDISAWKAVNVGLVVLGIIGVLIIAFLKLPENEPMEEKQKLSYKEIIQNPAFIFFVMILGLYFIAEHGIMNWLITYSVDYLQFSMEEASKYLSIFFMGITIGRLIISPLVDKMGVYKSVTVFSSIGCVLYVIGICLGKQAILLLSISGIFFAILYPTLILMIRNFYPSHMIATATGTIISVATLFDIGFNMIFGVVIDAVGFGKSIFILPLSMIGFCVTYFIFKVKMGEKDNLGERI